MEILIIGIVTAFNVLVIKWKLEKQRYEDAAFDFLLLLGLSFVFAGTYAGMAVATITSLIISIYFMMSPPLFITNIVVKIKTFIKELND